AAVCLVSYINGSPCASHRATVGYISVHLSLYYSTNEGCRVSPGTPVSLRFVPHAHGSEVRSLPLIITCPFAEPLCSCSPLTGFPAEKKGSCPQPGGFGQGESAPVGCGKSST